MTMKTAFARGSAAEKMRQWGMYFSGRGLARLDLSTPFYEDVEIADITEDEAMVWDDCMCLLKVHNARAFKICKLLYLSKLPELAVKNSLGLEWEDIFTGDAYGCAWCLATYEHKVAKDTGLLRIVKESQQKQKKSDITAAKIRKQIVRLEQQGLPVSKTNVAKLVGISRQQLTRRYSDLFHV